MQEHFVHALVLSKKPYGEFNARVVLYTKELGKISARVQSVYKLTSKLAAHSEPGMVIEARLVETKGFQLVDALMTRPLILPSMSTLEAKRQLEILHLIEAVSFEGHPDTHLWDLVEAPGLTGLQVLKTLGFDPEHAKCFYCGADKPVHFILAESHYACENCYRRIARSSKRFQLVGSTG